MRALASAFVTAVVLLAPSAPTAQPIPSPSPVSAPVLVSPVAPAHPEPVGRPGELAPAGRSSAPDAKPDPDALKSSATSAASSPAVVPAQAVIDKVGQGDRLFLAGDYRSALFAYQDAVYLEPRYVPARVKLGRTYLALRYSGQAISQAEAALAVDPGSPEALKLLEDAKNPQAGQVQAPPYAASNGAQGFSSPAGAPNGRSAPRVFRFTPEPDEGQASGAGTPAGSGGSQLATSTAPANTERIVTIVRVPEDPPEADPRTSPQEPRDRDAPQPSPMSAADHYRAALLQIQRRDFGGAVSELSAAIETDPGLAVAYAARGSAYFGLSRYREAAKDYQSALSLDAKLATPLYGLAESHRMLGDSKRAAEMYKRYSESGAPDVRKDLRAIAAKRAQELR